MKIAVNFISLFICFFSSSSIAGGYIFATNGSYEYNMNMLSSNMNNEVGTVLSESFSSNALEKEEYYYDCVALDSARTSMYVTAKYIPSMTPLSDGWYSFNDYFDIKTELYMNDTYGNAIIPVTKLKTNDASHTACTKIGRVDGTGVLKLGSRGILSLRLKKKIVNGYQFPRTKLASLAAAKSVSGELDPDISKAFANITIEPFSIDLPEKCEINAGQTMDIDFGNVSTTKLDGVHYPETRNLNISCSSGDFESGLSGVTAEFIGGIAGFSNDYFATNHDGIGIMIKDDGNTTIKPHDKKVIKLTDGKNNFPVVFYPVAESTSIDAGDFSANIIIRLLLE